MPTNPTIRRQLGTITLHTPTQSYQYKTEVQTRDANNKIASEVGVAIRWNTGKSGLIGYAGPGKWFGPDGKQFKTRRDALDSI
jgi:hypothetical protein